MVPSLSGRPRTAEEAEKDGSGSPQGGFEEAVAEAYAAGLEVGFAGMFAGEARRRVALPGYPFQRRRYWVDSGRRRQGGGTGHPLLGERRESARGETTFDRELYATEPEWLWDHRVFGQVVAPGAMYGAMALMAAPLCAGPEHAGKVTLTDMRFHVPLVLPEGVEKGAEPGRTVQMVLGAEDGSKQRSVEVYSRGEDSGGWTLHAEARVGLEAAPSQAGTDPDALVERLSEHDVAAAYRSFAAAGGELGPSFRVVQSLWSGSGEVVGEVSLSAELSESGVSVHPVVLDGCFQVLIQAMKERTEDAGEGEAASLYLPFGWERLWVNGALPERVTCHARLREGGGEAGAGSSGPAAEVMAADLWLYGEGGVEVGGVSGLVLKRATRAALLGMGAGGGVGARSGLAAGPGGVGGTRGGGSGAAGGGGGREVRRGRGDGGGLGGTRVGGGAGLGRRPGAADGFCRRSGGRDGDGAWVER